VRRIVVAAPPSVTLQWKEELDQRFGLTFVVFDRDYVRRMRQERGFSVNPWATHSRFIVSHHLLRDEDYASPLRDWSSSSLRGRGSLGQGHAAAETLALPLARRDPRRSAGQAPGAERTARDGGIARWQPH
jgi:hypothetical protein